MTDALLRSLAEAQAVVATCDSLAGFVQDGYEHYADDLRTQWAVEMGFIRIGESVNRLDPEVLERHPEQPWKDIISLRNFTAHQYEQLMPTRVWRTLTHEVPALREYLVATVIPALQKDLGTSSAPDGVTA